MILGKILRRKFRASKCTFGSRYDYYIELLRRVHFGASSSRTLQPRQAINGTGTRSGRVEMAARGAVRYQEILIHSALGMRFGGGRNEKRVQTHHQASTTSRSYPPRTVHFSAVYVILIVPIRATDSRSSSMYSKLVRCAFIDML